MRGGAWLAATLVLAGIPLRAHAQDGRELSPAERQAAALASLDPHDRSLLLERKVLLVGPPFKQVFEPYLSSSVPVFVTSDSILHGYHVLLNESMIRLESAQAARLPWVLRKVWDNLPSASSEITGRPDLLRRAQDRAAILVAVGLRLLGDDVPGMGPARAEIVEAEVARVTAARGLEKPTWLGPPDPGFQALDYGRFAPRGFYAESAGLARYFRAVSFLQAIPFRVGNDEEFLAALLLGQTVGRGSLSLVERWVLRGFLNRYCAFLGQEDDWGLLEAARAAGRELDFSLDDGSRDDSLESKRRDLLGSARRGGGPPLNDPVRYAPEEPGAAAEPGFRFLAAFRLPDTDLFYRTTDPRRLSRPWPNPLEVAALLGSDRARELVLAREGDENARRALAEALDGAGSLFVGARSLYGDYLRCIGAVLDAPGPDAPRFMRGEAWRAKSLNTALAGWGQMRRTFVLQAKPEEHWLKEFGPPAGYVEPDPDFFSRLASVSERTADLLRKAGAFRGGPRGLTRCLRDAASLLEQRLKAGKDLRTGLEPDEEDRLRRARRILEDLRAPSEEEFHEDLRHFIAEARRAADALDEDSAWKDDLIEALSRHLDLDVEPLWREFVASCRRLESMAHRQLRRVPFDTDDRAFLASYGKRLAGYCLYRGNAYLTPRDDAPRVVDVHSNARTGGYLEVGVSRPRRLYVLYDIGEEEVVCAGAVLPYREAVSSERLTDEAWRSLLDAGKVPPCPAWAGPFLGKDAGDSPSGAMSPNSGPRRGGG